MKNPLYLSRVVVRPRILRDAEDAEPLPEVEVIDFSYLITDPHSNLIGSPPDQPAPNANLYRYGSPLITVGDTFDHNYHTRDFSERVLRQDFNGEFTRAGAEGILTGDL